MMSPANDSLTNQRNSLTSISYVVVSYYTQSHAVFARLSASWHFRAGAACSCCWVICMVFFLVYNLSATIGTVLEAKPQNDHSEKAHSKWISDYWWWCCCSRWFASKCFSLWVVLTSCKILLDFIPSWAALLTTASGRAPADQTVVSMTQTGVYEWTETKNSLSTRTCPICGPYLVRNSIVPF